MLLRRRSIAVLKAAYGYFRESWNSSPYNHDVIVHHCGFGCRCTREKPIRYHLGQSAIQYMLARKMRQGSMKDHTSNGESGAWLSNGYCHNMLIVDLCQIAFSDLTVSHEEVMSEAQCGSAPVAVSHVFSSFSYVPSHSVDNEPVDTSDAGTVHGTLSFHQLAGRRITSTQQHLLNESASTKTIGSPNALIRCCHNLFMSSPFSMDSELSQMSLKLLGIRSSGSFLGPLETFNMSWLMAGRQCMDFSLVFHLNPSSLALLFVCWRLNLSIIGMPANSSCLTNRRRVYTFRSS